MLLLSRNKTPLTAVGGLSDEQILVLKACGVRTWEEYCAYAHTYSGVEFGGSDMFRSKVGDAVFDGIANAKVKERPAGFVIPDDSLQQMMATCGETFSTAAETDVVVGDFHKDGLPHEVRLMDRMPSIKDQGERGTCTAFASVALCEFAEGCETELSPQFLYWASKERDGRPNHEGTYLDTVQSVLYEIGVCEERLWPYNANSEFDDDGILNAGQGPAPEEAVEDAHKHRVSCRALSPKSVREIRKLLASGCPVVVGLTTFQSWTTNPMTAETGRVPMPYMRRGGEGDWHVLEKPSGGHAMCIVGYVDDSSAAGGGYFIVRNSWGEAWASECEEGAGHALIPYRYVALFCHAAFTLLDEAHDKAPGGRPSAERASPSGVAAPLDGLPPKLRPFARILDREGRDFMGRLLPKGARVLSLQEPGSPIVEYSPANFNTEEYIRILQAAQRLSEQRWPAELEEQYASVLRCKQEFRAKLGENLSVHNLRHKPFPELKFSWNLLQVMGTRRIASSKEVKDFSRELFDALLEEAVPAEHSKLLSDEWRKRMGEAVSARVYKVSSISILPSIVYVVEVFATPLAFDAELGICKFANASSRLVDTVRKSAVAAMGGTTMGKFVFYSIGTGLPLDREVLGIRDGGSSVTVSGPAEGGGWDVRRPSYLTGRTSFRDFSDRMMPVTKEDLVSAVKKFVDRVGRDSQTGKVTVTEIIDHLHGGKDGDFGRLPPFRETAVVRALLEMRGSSPGKYAVCRESGGANDVFVIPAANRIESDRVYKGRSWFANMLVFHSIHFVGILACAVIFVGRAEAEKWLGWGHGFLASVILSAVTMFVCGLIQSGFNNIVSSMERN
jgi:hypothetical protein